MGQAAGKRSATDEGSDTETSCFGTVVSHSTSVEQAIRFARKPQWVPIREDRACCSGLDTQGTTSEVKWWSRWLRSERDPGSGPGESQGMVQPG